MNWQGFTIRSAITCETGCDIYVTEQVLDEATEAAGAAQEAVNSCGDPEELQAALDQATEELEGAQSVADDAAGAVETAQGEVDQAQTSFDEADAQYQEVQTALSDATAAKDAAQQEVPEFALQSGMISESSQQAPGCGTERS